VEAIKGTDVDIPDAVFAWRLDGKGESNRWNLMM
jgi:zinc transporter